jgi:hypothetical protein
MRTMATIFCGLLGVALAVTVWGAESPAADTPAETAQAEKPVAEKAEPAKPAGDKAVEKTESTVEVADDATSPKEQLSKLSMPKLDWYQKIQTLAHGRMLNVPTPKYRKAESELLAITDANAIEPIALTFYNKNTRWRSTFVKASRGYAQRKDKTASPLAVAYLSDVAVRDPSSILRGKARSALLHADTPRHPERLRYHLAASRNEAARDRAAGLLADLKDRRTMYTMVNQLVTEEWRLVSKMVEARSVQMDIRTSYAFPPDMSNQTTITAAVPMGLATAQITLPVVRVTSINTTVSAPAGYRIEYQWEKRTIRHGTILGALRRLSGKSFGYERAAWMKWLREQEDIPRRESGSTGGSGSPYDVHWE